MFQSRRTAAERADSLTRALLRPDDAAGVNQHNRELLDLAQSLRPAESQSEAHRSLVRSRLFRGAASDQRADAGSRDGLEVARVHVTHIGDPAVGTIRVADIEPISPKRIVEVSERLSEALERFDERAQQER